MAWNFSNSKPIFQQLADIITLRIISGEYLPGDKLEAVRDLALTAGVNPNTMQRALSEIEDTGLIYTKRGDGRYVGEDVSVMNRIRDEYVRRRTDDYVSFLTSLGLTGERIREALNAGLEENNKKGGSNFG